MALSCRCESLCEGHRDGSYICGYVESQSSLEALLDAHQCAMTSTFVTRTSRVGAICRDLLQETKFDLETMPKILFSSKGEVNYDGTPFCVGGTKRLNCMF